MGDNKVRAVVEQIVGEVVGGHLNALCSEVVDKVSARFKDLAAGEAMPDPSTGLLNNAIRSVQDNTAQADILGALVEGCGKFSQRTALFVLRSGNASGWRARGFANNDAIKSLTIDASQALVTRAVQDRLPVSASASEFDPAFVATMGKPAGGTNVLLLPLVVREKVAALVYADVGASAFGKLDASALETLVRFTSLWIEAVAARKAGTPADAPMPTQSAPIAAAAAASAMAGSGTVLMPSRPEPQPERVAPTPEPPPEAPPAGNFTPEDEEVHKKAKRFAKLLVDEIKLYNKKKVEEGRASGDLYRRLRDDIDKSRATYDKRFGHTAAASGDYFVDELVRVLANGDKTLLGSGFSG